VKSATKDVITDFIYDEIYMHFGAPQEIFMDGGKNLWADVVQRYLKKIGTLHKGTSPYHPRTNGKVERLNGIIGSMLGKLLLGKPTLLWDLYLDQALFACRVRTNATTKTSPFYLVYGQQPHLFGDVNQALPNDATPEGHEKRIKLLQSARVEATIAAYERAFKDRNHRNELVVPHQLDAGDWVLVRHEIPNKFEPKWFGPYQITQKMLLGTYRLQDPNGTELEALIHGNRLIKAAISTADALKDLWASPAVKDMLRKKGIHAEVAPSYPENTALLNQQLRDDEGIPLPTDHEDQPTATSARKSKQRRLKEKAQNDKKIVLKINLKRIREQQVMDDIISKRQKTTTPSST